MLALSPTMEEGTIVRWTKHEGQSVSAGDVICEVETDKATMDYESTEVGTVLKILVPEGRPARVGEPIAIIGNKGEDISELLLPDTGTAKQEPPQQAHPETKEAQGSKHSAAQNDPRSSPAARIAAKERGINIAAIEGTGPSGRIIEADVLKAVQTQRESITPAQTGDMVKPASTMRKAIAKRMVESKFSAPDYYVRIKVVVDALLEARQHINAQRDRKISLNAFLIKLAAQAIERYPVINSTWRTDAILQHGTIDIGLAVALEDGLIVPVVRDCGNKGIMAIESQLTALIEKAKAGKLTPEEYTGATFTISNLGSFGIDEFTAIINPPGAAILTVGAIIREPTVTDNAVGIASVMRLTLVCDHRSIDGAVAAAFASQLRELMQYPVSELL